MNSKTQPVHKDATDPQSKNNGLVSETSPAKPETAKPTSNPLTTEESTMENSATENSVSEPNKNVQRLELPLLAKSSFFLLIWMILFAAGLLCETSIHRYTLAPLDVKEQLGKDGMERLESLIRDNVALESRDSNAVSPLSTEVPKPVIPNPLATNRGESINLYPNASKYRAEHSDPLSQIAAFFIALFCFTPTNLALLSFVAALIGGYASNIRYDKLPPELSRQLNESSPTSVAYMQEPPMSAAIRGFVVYLCVIAGLYVVLDDPFKSPSSGQYIRLAGTLSILAFTAGYDPNRLSAWLGIVPYPGKQGSQAVAK